MPRQDLFQQKTCHRLRASLDSLWPATRHSSPSAVVGSITQRLGGQLRWCSVLIHVDIDPVVRDLSGMMHPANDGPAVYLCGNPIDLRKAINGQAILVDQLLAKNPFS